MIDVVSGGGDDDDDGSGRSDDFYYDENHYFEYDRLNDNRRSKKITRWMARQAPLSFSLMSSYYY